MGIEALVEHANALTEEVNRLRAENARKDERIAELESLLLAARATVEYWTPDESIALRCEEEPLDHWYALRDRIDAALSTGEGKA